MSSSRLTAVLAAAGFVFTIWLANWLIKHYGPVRVWPTRLHAPAGVYAVGLAFVLRDVVQRLTGRVVPLALVAVGCGVSALVVDAGIAGASAAAFAASEAAGLALFWAAGGRTGGPPRVGLAVVLAGAAAAALDSYVFLSLAPQLVPGLDNVSAFFDGQVVAKLSVTVLAIPLVLASRRRFTPQAALA